MTPALHSPRPAAPDRGLVSKDTTITVHRPVRLLAGALTATTAAAVTTPEPTSAVADWEAASRYVTDFRADRIHPRAQGLSVYARLVRLAVDRATGVRTVTAQPGQTLSGIAVAYAVPGGWSALAAYNGITDPGRISVGQVLRLPAATTTALSTYTVTAGTRSPAPPVCRSLSCPA